MPQTPVRVGVPTSLTRELVEKVTAGFVDQVTLELKNLRVRKSGTVKKVVTLGEYALDVHIEKVAGRLKTGKPDVRFGGNKISIALPVTVASGGGKATIGFKWDGKNVSGAVCGDMDIEQVVTGKVKPDSYPVSGALLLTAGAEQILAAPKFPPIKVNLKIDPSPESWAAVQKIIDDKEGACGFVLDKVDVLKIVRGLIDRGFNVRLPTEKIKPMAVPVGIEPEMKRARPAGRARDQGRRPRDHRGHDLARGRADGRPAEGLGEGARRGRSEGRAASDSRPGATPTAAPRR